MQVCFRDANSSKLHLHHCGAHFVLLNVVGPIDPKALLLPFLRMIRSQTISGPYVRKAIESIQSFLLGDILLGDPQHTCDALDEIVVAITRYNLLCRT